MGGETRDDKTVSVYQFVICTEHRCRAKVMAAYLVFCSYRWWVMGGEKTTFRYGCCEDLKGCREDLKGT